jgi:type II secretory pathway pseudopilin PulG
MEGSNTIEREPKTKASGRSIASMVLGIISLIIPCAGFITGLLGVIFGGLEMKAIKEGRTSSKGKGFALTGLITGIAGVAFQFVYILMLTAIAIPNFIRMQDRAKESDVKSVAHTVQLAIEDYKTTPGKEGIKPTSVSEIDSFLPTNVRDKQNPFNSSQKYSSSGGGLVDGYPTQSGQVGYVFTGQREPYKVIAFGKDQEPILTLEEGY